MLRIGTWGGLFELAAAAANASASFDVGPGMGGGAALRAAMEPARKAARSSLPIIVCGETGTGKEVAARTIHAWSGRQGDLYMRLCGLELTLPPLRERVGDVPELFQSFLEKHAEAPPPLEAKLEREAPSPEGHDGA